ncbi:hypothetical protein [Hugenholtzia roseola]|uniref:hypothetical protein n=1 Tax=Hugenholtzia roseola TaxID=1002 RepID=UPI00040CD30B|nr:hypothetical protein [Hugenholtzia roseola]
MDWATSFFLVSLSYLLYKAAFRLVKWQGQRSESWFLKEKIKLLERRIENLETLSLGESLSDWYQAEQADLYRELSQLEGKKDKKALAEWEMRQKEIRQDKIRKKIKKIVKKKD